MINVPRYGLKDNSSHIISKRSLQTCEEDRPFFLTTKKYNNANHVLNVLPDCMCLPQLTVQDVSWNVSSAGSTRWSSCYLTPVRELSITAAPPTNTSWTQWSLRPAVTKSPAWTGTVVCSVPARMQVTAWSWLWRCLNYAIISRKPILITNHATLSNKLVG